MVTKEKIEALVKQYTPKICELRRQIHENPELSYEEVETSALMAKTLRSLGIEVQETVAGLHAVIGTLYGAKPGPTIALRTDMDALSILKKQIYLLNRRTPAKCMHAVTTATCRFYSVQPWFSRH